jgi:tryptophan halogenase
MTGNSIRSIVIVGGGTAGWMAAAAFAKVLGPRYDIRLIESELIGTSASARHRCRTSRRSTTCCDRRGRLRPQDAGHLQAGHPVPRLGRIGDRYIHGFGTRSGATLGLLPFHQYWIKARQAGRRRRPRRLLAQHARRAAR